MSTAPPSFASMSPKSFWKKPEGKPGMILTAALAAAGVYGLWLALPFLLGVVWGTVNLAIGVGALALIGYVVTNGTVQTLAKNIFQSVCRGVALLYTTIDPIGILKNWLDDMKKAKAQLDETIQRFAGSDQKLKSSIARKKAEIQQLAAEAAAAQRMMGSKTDDLERERIALQKETYEQKAGLLMQAIEQLQALETQTGDMLLKFRHWSQVSDAKIERTSMKVEILAEQRQMVLDAKSTLSVGMRLLKGDPEQLKLVDGAIEFLTDDAERTFGEIQEFNRFSDKMLTDIDIENSANAELARQKFAEFGAKIEESANRPSAVDQLQHVLAGADAPKMPASPYTSAPGGGKPAADYSKLFNK